MSPLVTLVLATLALVSLSSCFSNTYEVADSKVLVRYLPDKDALLVVEVEHGIQSPGRDGPSLRKAVDALRKLAAGARIFPASGEWFATDFDEAVEKNPKLTDEERAELVEFQQAIHVEDHGLFLENDGRLSFFRFTRLEHFRRMLEITNGYFNRTYRAPEEDSKRFEPAFPNFDEASWNMCHSAISGGHQWLSTESEAIVLDVPMTSTNAAACLGWIAREGRKSTETKDDLQFFEQLSSLELSDGHVRLRFAEEPKRVLRFHYHSKSTDSSKPLIEELEKAGVALSGEDKLNAAMEKFNQAPAAESRPK